MRTPKQRLTDFLYTLLRDKLPAGEIERLVIEHVERQGEEESIYSNPFLAGYADELATRILNGADSNYVDLS